MTEPRTRRKSFFEALGFSKTIAVLTEEIRSLYLSDDTPWVIGYSGGKDSTAVTQLTWLALGWLAAGESRERSRSTSLPPTRWWRTRWLRRGLTARWRRCGVRRAATSLPFQAMLLPPETADTFWVNLIGKGYPAPRPGFRWCTERLKIKPSSRFIENTANQYGEAILLLGARRAESSVRSASLDRREVLTKEGLTAHSELVSTLVYSPIQDWSNEDVWLFLNRDSQSVGPVEQGSDGAVSRGDGRQRVPDRGRHLDAELRQQPIWLLGLHARRSGQVDEGDDPERRRQVVDAAAARVA